MDTNPVIEMLGRPLRLAVIGGGPGSFIGAMHRTAARLDGRYELVAGVVSSDPERSQEAAAGMGIDPSRAYTDAIGMLDAESEREDGAEVVAIMTPNDSHHRYALAALDRGFDVICDKPMTNTLDEALDIVRKVDATGLVFCLTHNYTGYPMVRQARALVEDGQVGEIRLVQVEYVQGGKADESDPDPADGLPWRYHPVRGGPSLVMGDIGTHAHNLVRFVSGLEVAEVAAEIGHVIPERPVDDYGAAMLRFDNGARGTFWVTQTAAGVENGLRHPRVGHEGQPGVAPGTADAAHLQAARRTGSRVHAERARGSAGFSPGMPDRGRAPGGLPRSLRQHLLGRGRGDRRAALGPGARSAGAAVPEPARRRHRGEVRRGGGRVERRQRCLDGRQALARGEVVMPERREIGHVEARGLVAMIGDRLDANGEGAAVAVVDPHGELVAFLRTDGCGLASINIAIHKAFTAARERVESSVLGERSRTEGFPITNFGDPRYVGWGGGVPIVVDGEVIGAVGVSGLPEAADIELARWAAASLADAG